MTGTKGYGGHELSPEEFERVVAGEVDVQDVRQDAEDHGKPRR